jgi:hypothetical protein
MKARTYHSIEAADFKSGMAGNEQDFYGGF